MISVDANIIVYALNADMEEHDSARAFMQQLAERDDVAIAEQTLVEVYLLVRNPTVFKQPFAAEEAVAVCARYRQNPRWQVVECHPVMEQVWREAGETEFARRRIIDARLACTLRAAGVHDFATRNVDHFKGYGFSRVWDPVSAAAGR